MKETIRKDAIIPYKVLRRRSPMPFLAAGVVFLVYGAARPLYSPTSYLFSGAVALVAYAIARGIWPDKRIKIELAPATGDAQADQLLTEAREAMVAIHEANERIADPKVSAAIQGVEDACIKILARLEEQPALYGQLRTFLRYYVPTTRKLLEARSAIEQGGAMKSGNAKEVCARTDRVLPQIQSAFEKQLEALDKHRYLDLQVEMDVLEGMLKSDGLYAEGRKSL